MSLNISGCEVSGSVEIPTVPNNHLFRNEEAISFERRNCSQDRVSTVAKILTFR